VLVLTVPYLQPVHLCHLVQHFQLLNLEMRRLHNGLVSAFTALVFEAVNLADECTAFGATFVAFRSVVVQFAELVALIALRDVVVVCDALRSRDFIFLGGGVVAAIPVVAVYDEYVFGVEVIAEDLSQSFLILLQRCFHVD
jgi:hypothetical protein